MSVWRRVVSGIFGAVLLVGLPQTVHAAEPLYEETFSSVPWQTVFNQQYDTPEYPCRGPEGDSAWSYQDEAATLHIVNSVPCKMVIAPASFDGEWPVVAEVSYTFKVSDPEMDRNLLFRWEDSGNYIGFHIYNTHITPEKFVEGRSYAWSQGGAYFRFRSNTTYTARMYFDQSSGSLRLWINTVLVFDGQEHPNDPQLLVGGPALAGSVGWQSTSLTSFDSYSLQDRGSTISLSVPQRKQDDTRWGVELYDHAVEWSEDRPTVARWGCALTSAVMVFRYHGITQLPDGTTLEPNSLNLWLLSQPDGYIPPGLVNWRALSRLSRWHSDLFGTPALEMQFESPDNPLQWAIDMIALGYPPILDHGGHFTVGHSSGPGTADLSIHDPLYPRTSLADYSSPFLSARLFTPSFTDLRAVSVYVRPGTKLSVPVGSAVSVPEPISVFTLQDPERMQPQERLLLYDFPKIDTSFSIEVDSNHPSEEIRIYSYDSQGELQNQEHLMLTPTQPLQVDVEIENDGTPQIFVPPSKSGLESILLNSNLAQWLSWQQIRSPYSIESIQQVQNQIQSAPELQEAQDAFESWLLSSVHWVRHGWIDQTVKNAIDSALSDTILQRFP